MASLGRKNDPERLIPHVPPDAIQRGLMLPIIETIERQLMRVGLASGAATLLITLCVVADVVGRNAFNNPIHGATEMSELLLVVMVFVGLAAAQQERQNYAIDMATRHLPMGLQTVLEFFSYLFCLCVVLTLAWFSTNQAISAYTRGEAGFGIFPFPVWPARFVLAIGLWLLAMQYLCDIARMLIGHPRIDATAGSHE